MSPQHIPPSGIWAPAVTMFDPETDSLDLEAQAQYYSYLSKTGLAGLVILGTNAEAFLLTREERKALIATARKAVGPDFPIMAGVGQHSTKQVLENIADAAEAGADSVLVLPPGYFGKATTPEVVANFFAQVSAKSALPIVLYNFPGVCNGVDLGAGVITALAQKHANIVGVKLTCGSVAKITCLSSSLSPDSFATFGGQSDFLIGGLASGSAGCIAAFANIFPKALVQIYQLYRQGKHAEALALHQKAALAEQVVKGDIAATKYAAALHSAAYAGIQGAEVKFRPRAPYVEPKEAQKEAIKKGLAEMAKIEESLPMAS
ncbi:dihydrodipicolinate synthetase [Microdochium trichocladiopsis]|uniref:Dihydrodipicolinate synthetase n=1 Tax=Microdochium trichocladiopsis TaxID=1682393 RepID=A0A9P8Y6B1_9PEZI|nr:dihydrodipicolinate synthetase [Microdochium trichocladiopsis]KAH7030718.1 dihydrodipicolinate synthetase [Microdochium trichocladiopsis]